MFRPLPRWLPLLLTLALAAGPAAGAADNLQQKQKALDSVRDRIADLQKKVEADQGQRDQLSQDLQRVEQRVSGVRGQLRSLQQRITAQTQALRDTEAQQAEVQQSLASGHQQLARQLRAAFVLGQQPQTQLLLNLDDVARVGRTMTYYDYLQRAQLAAIAAIRSRAQELEVLAARQQQEQAQLEQLRREQQGQLGELQDSRNERSGVLKQIKQRIAGEQDNLVQLKEDERSIRALIESLKKALATLPPDVGASDNPFTQQKGKLPWPLRGPLLAQYGQAKADGRLSWNGHWIGGPAGAPVRAVARGRAVYVGWMHRYGLIVLIEHEGGYFSLYGHCQSAAVAAGDAVRAGQVIAAAGDSGGHEQTGVYFEIRRGSEAINPQQWLAR